MQGSEWSRNGYAGVYARRKIGNFFARIPSIANLFVTEKSDFQSSRRPRRRTRTSAKLATKGSRLDLR